jgi:MerR family copper efflux transcriptional regulator
MKIGELAALTGVTPDTLRYYEKQGLIEPAGRTASRYRHYGDQAVNRIRFIKSAQSLGFALQDIAKLLPQLDQGQLKRSDIEVQLTEPSWPTSTRRSAGYRRSNKRCWAP